MKQLFCFIQGLLIAGIVQAQLSNPLLPSGADPWSIYKDGYYYYTHTAADRIIIWKTKRIADLKTAEQKTIFIPPAGTAYSKNLWAPEIHFLEGKWYVYFTANGNGSDHRLFVLENASADPLQGEWTFKGKIADPSDKWAIDGSVFTYKGTMYLVWSGWEGDKNGQQDIYIAKMKNPWTIEGNRSRISSPVLSWERDGDIRHPNFTEHVNVNEGPQPLLHDDRLFIIYSASGCWTDNYALGMLTFDSKKDPLDSTAWHKHPEPVFKKSEKNGVYAPGHNSFFTSPDGKEDWILYHANSKPGQGCGGKRSPRAQRFTWKDDGTPDFGEPLPEGPLPIRWSTSTMINNVPVFEDKGPVTEAGGTQPREHGKYGAQYGRMLLMGDKTWLAAYTVSRNDGYQKDSKGGLQLEISRSSDQGRTWKVIGSVAEPGRDVDNAQMIRLKDGSILLACRSVRWQESYRLPVYRSTNGGITWKKYSLIDSNEGAPGTLGKPDQGMYEPHLLFLDNGELAVMYANEKYAKQYSQIISQRISKDNGRTWGEERKVVLDPAHPSSRPGMPVWTKMKNGRYMLTYEICGPEQCAIYYKTSDDGVHWPEGLGTPIPDQFGAPYVLSLHDGRLVLTSNKSNVSVSDDFGLHWRTQERAWEQTLWPSLYEISEKEIGAVNSVQRKEGGHAIQVRFGEL